jgi:flagellar basal body-associated protein FliL
MRKTILIIGIIAVIIVLGISVILFINYNKTVKTETQEPESYISCGCGCCSFQDKTLEEIAQTKCLYKSKGEHIQDRIDRDKQLSPDFCATVGCSFPVKYIYCD